MKRSFTLVVALILYNAILAQVTLICPPGSSVTFIYTGANGSCVTTAPTKGNVRYAVGANCANATSDAVFVQGVCSCCPIFNNDCIKYTNTNPTPGTDVFVIGGITYTVHIAATQLTCPAGGSVTFLYTGPNGSCVTTAPAKGNIKYAVGPNCANATSNAVFVQGVCSCCPIFNNDCIKYTNTNPTPGTDIVVIGGISYVVNITSTLPVTLTGTKAYQKNTGVQVEWTTAEESNMNRYDVERSPTGDQFANIGTVQPLNNCPSACNYELLDPTPHRGANFYRIKMIDNSGEIKYSRVMKVNTGNGSSQITVAPNPLTGNSITLQLHNLPKGKYSISMVNNAGQTVLSRIIQHNGGSATQTVAPDNNLAAGTYQLTITGGEITIVKRIIK
jgi:hypothetical protein